MSNYNAATSEMARAGRSKMEAIIAQGRQSAASVIETVLSRTIVDSVVRTPAVRLVPTDGAFELEAKDFFKTPLHDHAFGQVLADAGVPKRFTDYVQQQAGASPWGKELVAHNVNEILYRRSKQRNLVRHETSQIKGFLSDSFKRLDSRPLLEAYMTAVKRHDLLPIQGVVTDTKVSLRAVLPVIFEPVPNEVMLFGTEWRNSDYGDGGHQLSLWLMRVVCTNLAIGETTMRQIHLGKKLPENIELSKRTYELDTQHSASLLGDIVKATIAPERINGMVAAIAQSSEEELKRDGIVNRLKKYLTAPEIDKAMNAFESPDVVNLPAGNTTWRLSNTLSWLAQSRDLSPDRRMDYEKAAGDLLPIKAKGTLVIDS